MYLLIIWNTHRWDDAESYLFTKKLTKKELAAWWIKTQKGDKADFMWVWDNHEWVEYKVENWPEPNPKWDFIPS